MSILGRVFKGTVGLCANGLEYVIAKTAHVVVNKYGENELVSSASEVGANAVRATESTVKTLADVVDGGIDAGVGFLAKDDASVNNGLERSKVAGKDLVVGAGRSLTYTAAAGAKTAASAAQAGKYYISGDKYLAGQELRKTKGYAKRFGKVVAVGLLALGPIKNGDKNQLDE